MKLIDLSREYRAQAAVLRSRIAVLEQDAAVLPERERARRADRIRILSAMWRETRDIAVLCERYYERGYRRNGRYTL